MPILCSRGTALAVRRSWILEYKALHEFSQAVAILDDCIDVSEPPAGIDSKNAPDSRTHVCLIILMVPNDDNVVSAL